METKKLFYDIAYDNIHRRGITAFLDYLDMETDFFTAPASTKYHGSYQGGLVMHSLEVYAQFLKLAPIYNYDMANSILCESATICTLFHDVCKINTYKESCRNIKDEKTGEWKSVPCYVNDDKNVFGAHGAYSVYLINEYMHLNREETIAIYHHMGAWDIGKNDNPSKAYECVKLAWLLHVADEAATYIAGT